MDANPKIQGNPEIWNRKCEATILIVEERL